MVLEHDFSGCGYGADERVRIRLLEGAGVVDVEVILGAGIGRSGVRVELREGCLVRCFAGDPEFFSY